MMAGKSVVILGAGFGGITAALDLRQGLGAEHSVILIDRQPSFMMGLRKLWWLVGQGTRAEGVRSRARLAAKGIEFRQASIRAIDLRGRVVHTDANAIRFDFLIVALGAEPRPDLVPGYSGAVYNLYDVQGIEQLAPRIRELRAGRVTIGILGLPYKCPPAPYEAAMLLDHFFHERGNRDAVELAIFTPQPSSLPVLGTAGCTRLEAELAQRRIAFSSACKTVSLDGTTVVADRARIESDVLIAVPPHRPPRVVGESGLALRGDWLAVEPTTLRTSIEGVFAVGDVMEIPLANGMPLPKAGIFAEGQAKVAAAAILAELTGQPAPPPYDGQGYCFVEVGGGKASKVVGAFLAVPAPQVHLVPPAAAAYAEKQHFEQSRLEAWF